MHRIFVLLGFILLLLTAAEAQVKPLSDSLPPKAKAPKAKKAAPKHVKVNIFKAPDSIKPYPPRLATIRSAVLPGWGQITNKKYWKLPLVYGALGVTAGVFIYNLNTFKKAKNAYILATDNDLTNDDLIPEPYYSVRSQPERIRSFRNQIRQNVDYSALFFILFWGLNVVDATVDAHLKGFDVGDNLSLQFKAGYSPLAQTNGVSVVLRLGK
jgi:Family of unknown function (DUF5683)